MHQIESQSVSCNFNGKELYSWNYKDNYSVDLSMSHRMENITEKHIMQLVVQSNWIHKLYRCLP